jgi:DNA-binding beta-propeller fold protein YncE
MLLVLAACTDPTGDDTAPVETSLIGVGDGSPGSVGWTTILDSDDEVTDPRDIGFDEDGRLWVANREDDRTFIVNSPGTDAQDFERRKDGYAEHFMEEVAAFSFDGNGQFGSCGESRNTYNDAERANDFMGPVLWTTNLEIFANVDPIGLGSHLDMLHESPNCVGIAWEADNIYWVFDGLNKNIVRYDFQGDHGPGMDDHSDGIIQRVTELEVIFEPNAPAHMVLDPATGLLYIADTGNDRVLWLDTSTGEEGSRIRTIEPGVRHVDYDGVAWGVLIEGLDKPGGLALADDRLFVGEWATGVIYEYDLDGVELRSLDTGFGAESLHGIEPGPDGKLWVVDNGGAAVVRIDP